MAAWNSVMADHEYEQARPGFGRAMESGNQSRGEDLRRRNCAPYPRLTSEATTGRSAFVTDRVSQTAGM